MTNLEWLTREVLQRGTTNPDCIEWPYYKNDDGYGEVWVRGNKRRVHKIAYELVKGEVPTGMELDHSCNNRACFNPLCLEAVTHLENLNRSPFKNQNHNKSSCKRGHLFTKNNTRIDKRGSRICRTCMSAHMKNHRAKIREEVI